MVLNFAGEEILAVQFMMKSWYKLIHKQNKKHVHVNTVEHVITQIPRCSYEYRREFIMKL